MFKYIFIPNIKMTKPSFLKNSLSHLSEDLVSEIQKHLHEGVTFKNNTKIGVIFEAYKYELSNKSRKTKLKKLEKLLEKAEVQVVTMASRREKRQLRRELRAEKQRARSGLSTPGLIEGLHSSFEIARKQLISRMSFQLATDLVNVHAPRLSPEVKEPSIKSISGFIEQYLNYLVKPEPRGILPPQVGSADGYFKQKSVKQIQGKDSKGWIVYSLRREIGGGFRIDLVVNISDQKIGLLYVGSHKGHDKAFDNLNPSTAESVSRDLHDNVVQLRRVS